jgi:predicted  nucleic acid-binding Zn-ribbon protein
VPYAGEEEKGGEHWSLLTNELTEALERAERAETERAEISQLLAAREKDIEDLKRKLERNRAKPVRGTYVTRFSPPPRLDLLDQEPSA